MNLGNIVTAPPLMTLTPLTPLISLRRDLLRSPHHPTTHFLSEAVRYGASQKNSPRDSTKSYSPRTITFSDTPQIAAYHKKLFEGAENKSKLLILILNNILLSWKTTPRVYATYTHLSLVDVDIGVTILNKALRVLAVVL